MKFNLAFLAFAISFLTGCCDGVNDVTLLDETKSWNSYTSGQQKVFKNDKQDSITLVAETQNAELEGNNGKSSCSYKIERKVLKLTNTSPIALTIQLAFQSRNIYIGKSEAGPDSEAIFDVSDYNSRITGMNSNRYEYLSQVNLNGQDYSNVIHYFPGPGSIPDAENYFKEYYYVKDIGLVAFKLPNNPSFFYLN